MGEITTACDIAEAVGHVPSREKVAAGATAAAAGGAAEKGGGHQQDQRQPGGQWALVHYRWR